MALAEDVQAALKRRVQVMLDKSVIYPGWRWAAFGALLVMYAMRVYSLAGWYIVSYGLGIFLLNLFIGFLSPQMDPETEGPLLPMKNSEEYRPFVRRVPEFTFWTSAMRAVAIAFGMTFFQVFNIPVFWPILVIYFIILFTVTMKNQIAHMIKYRYIPINFGKKKFGGGGGGKGGEKKERVAGGAAAEVAGSVAATSSAIAAGR